MKTTTIISGIILIGLIAFAIYGSYQMFSDNGRWIRDYGIQSSGIADNEVKTIWCNNLGYEGSYHKIGNKEYCGEIEGTLTCSFTNKGDYCSFEKKETTQ